MDTLTLSKELGLTPKSAKKEKDLYYKGKSTNNKLVPCCLLELVCNRPKIVKINIDGQEKDISLEMLKDMQPTRPKSKNEPPRPYKGKSLLEFPQSFTVIDLETTGLKPEDDLIIELAGIKVRKGKIIDTFDELVNPGIAIPSVIKNLTNITDEMVINCQNINALLPNFLQFIGDDIILGHNVNFDVNFLYENCERHGFDPFRNDFVDTLRLSRKLYPNWPHHRLCDMAENLKVEQITYHRALADCETTLLCYQKLKENCGSKL